ncbi:MAG TPA: hypothetical protein VF137_08840 [Candidatus Dormibacteraeota bacterium]
MTDELDDLEERLRAAHAFEPRPGLQAEVRSQLRLGRQLPWAAFSAAAAVLVAAVGVGYLLSHSPHGLGTGASTSSASRGVAIAAFGPVPKPPLLHWTTGASAGGASRSAPAATPSAQADQVQPVFGLPRPAQTLPDFAVVYRWKPAGGGQQGCAPPAGLLYTVVTGPLPCGQPYGASDYRLAPAPSGSFLVYVGVSDGAYGYLEPAYEEPDGTIASALAPDELRG